MLTDTVGGGGACRARVGCLDPSNMKSPAETARIARTVVPTRTRRPPRREPPPASSAIWRAVFAISISLIPVLPSAAPVREFVSNDIVSFGVKTGRPERKHRNVFPVGAAGRMRGQTPLGRHKEYDPDQALLAALDVFRRQGFEGTSLTDLTNAMGINRPSLYAAFGNKEKLFHKALERYRSQCPVFGAGVFAEASARGVAERLLYGSADQQTDGSHPPGCLVTSGALLCSDEHVSVRQALADARENAQALLQRRLEIAALEGDLPADADPASLARYLMTIVHGMAVMAASGASRSALRDVAAFAMRAWPERSGRGFAETAA